MKIRTTRQATPEEAAAIIEDMQRRQSAGEEVREALARKISPETLAEVIASLPAELQRQFTEPTLRRTFKITRCKRP